MILSIIGQSSHTENAMLAANVAAARVKCGNRVLLIETDVRMSLFLWNLRRKHAKIKLPVLALVCGGLYAALQEYGVSYHDIVINAGTMPFSAARPALISSAVAVFPLSLAQLESDGQRLQSNFADTARLFNPLVRTRIFISECGNAIPVQKYAAAVSLAARFPTGSVVAAAALDLSAMRRSFDRGLTIFDDETMNESTVREMRQLTKQLYSGPEAEQSPASRATKLEMMLGAS